MSSTSHIRHGLHLPVDLLNQVRVFAREENTSVNKHIENIIRDWLARHKPQKDLSRRELLLLPVKTRRAILAEHAAKVRECYADMARQR